MPVFPDCHCYMVFRLLAVYIVLSATINCPTITLSASSGLTSFRQLVNVAPAGIEPTHCFKTGGQEGQCFPEWCQCFQWICPLFCFNTIFSSMAETRFSNCVNPSLNAFIVLVIFTIIFNNSSISFLNVFISSPSH